MSSTSCSLLGRLQADSIFSSENWSEIHQKVCNAHLYRRCHPDLAHVQVLPGLASAAALALRDRSRWTGGARPPVFPVQAGLHKDQKPAKAYYSDQIFKKSQRQRAQFHAGGHHKLQKPRGEAKRRLARMAPAKHPSPHSSPPGMICPQKHPKQPCRLQMQSLPQMVPVCAGGTRAAQRQMQP